MIKQNDAFTLTNYTKKEELQQSYRSEEIRRGGV